MSVLILGGTTFVGRHIVQAFLDAAHTVTILTRGKTNPHLFPEVGRLIGDRDTDLRAVADAVEARTAAGTGFDGCIDVSAYTLAQVGGSLDAVARRNTVGSPGTSWTNPGPAPSLRDSIAVRRSACKWWRTKRLETL